MKNDKAYIESYFKGKDLGVNFLFNGQLHYFPGEALLEATLESPPKVHAFVAPKLQVGSKKFVHHLMESIVENILKENMSG